MGYIFNMLLQGRRIMNDVKVPGTGCAHCRNTIRLIEEVAHDEGATINIEKVEAWF